MGPLSPLNEHAPITTLNIIPISALGPLSLILTLKHAPLLHYFFFFLSFLFLHIYLLDTPFIIPHHLVKVIKKMPSSRYTPSAYGDIDSGGWDNPPPHSQICKGPRSFPDPPRYASWNHDMCQDCGEIENPRSRSDKPPIQKNDHVPEQSQPRGRGQLRAPSIDNDNWSPAPARKEPVRIEPPKSNNGDDWGPTPTPPDQAPPSNNNDDGGDWGVPAPPARSIKNGNGNGNGNLNSSIPSRFQYRSTSRYDDEEDIEDDGDIPPPTSDPVHGAYVAWTGVV